jgi:hypothetical protein
MTTRRRRLVILVGLVCPMLLAVGCLWLLLGGTHSAVTKANFDRIEKGMTLAKVEELFGKKGAVFYGYVNKSACFWENEDRSYAIVIFDESRRVVEKAQWGGSPESIGDKIRRLLHWPWWK